MLDLINYINLDENLKQKVIDLALRNRGSILSLAEKCRNGNFSALHFKSDLTRLAVVIECLGYTFERYMQYSIDEEVFLDTVDDIRIWCENNDNKGLKNYNWIKNHISFELFRIGRLQYQFVTIKNKLLKYDLLPFGYGEKVIYVHIPQGEKLTYRDCVQSLERAKAFFEQHFPDYNYRFFFCESWLLYGDNQHFMLPESNILHFASLFNVAYSIDDDRQAIERIFGKRKIDKKKYKENTTLRKNAKKHLLNGGKLGIGIGFIDKESV